MAKNFPSLYEDLFYQALRIRMVEEEIIKLYPSDKIQSPVHLSIGQEAVAVGTCAALRKSDLVFSNYRGHAFYLAKGGKLDEMMAELYGKVTGCGRGKAGSMHLFSIEVGMMVSSAVVASTIPHAVGAAMAAKQNKTDQVIVAVFGDGATEEGVFAECLNFASLRKLPIIFLCENNGLAIHSRLDARQAYRIIDLPKAFKIPTVQCLEGWDFMKVQECMSRCVDAVRLSKGPYFVEIATCRYREHVGPAEDFESGYRSRSETEEWMKKDPLIHDHAMIEKYRSEIRAEIEKAVGFAESSPWPGPEELLAHIL